MAETGRSGESVTLNAREAWLIYRALGPIGKSPPTEADRLVYVEAVKKLKAAMQEASP